jgi:hypothetical protein
MNENFSFITYNFSSFEKKPPHTQSNQLLMKKDRALVDK